MTKLTLIQGTKPPDTPKERVRSRLRKTKTEGVLQCPSCGSRSHIDMHTGKTKQSICAFCFMNEKRMVSME